jgi:NAD(P)-dependent dehydrogenase (short-subunit alcohol dehydrogenase family)
MMTPPLSLRTYHSAVAIVTGGASGIGRALGEALARRGARVVLADLQIDLAREVADVSQSLQPGHLPLAPRHELQSNVRWRWRRSTSA